MSPYAMRSAVFCYAPEDEASAVRFGEYLEANLDLRCVYGECALRPAFDLLDAAGRALSADVAIVLLSPASVPRTWRREIWEPLLIAQPEEFGTEIAFVQTEECSFPALLRRRNFFDASPGWKEAARGLRQWLLHPGAAPAAKAPAHLNALRDLVSDRPGAAESVPAVAAAEFIAACWRDFQSVCRLDCLERTRAGIAGDLRRTGISARDRALLVLDRFPAESRDLLARFEAASFLFTLGAPEPQTESVGSQTRAMRALLATDPAAGLRLGWELLKLLDPDFPEEAVETLDLMAAAATGYALARIERTRSWLTGGTPQPKPAGSQLELFDNSETLCLYR